MKVVFRLGAISLLFVGVLIGCGSQKSTEDKSIESIPVLETTTTTMLRASTTSLKPRNSERPAASSVLPASEFCKRANEVTLRTDVFKDDESFVADKEWWVDLLNLELEMLEVAPTELFPLLPEIRNGISALKNVLEKYNFDIFNEHFRKKYYLKVPYKMMRAAKSSNY
jgi:hypothetical protein